MTTANPLQLALGMRLNRPLSEAPILAKAAEDVGFSDVWVTDHYYDRDTYAAQALIAEHTVRIRIGAAVAAALLRHPALLASSTAAIDELSSGRAIMGIGVGGFEFAAQLGLKPKSPLAVSRGTIRIARELFAGGADVTGDVFTASGARLQWDTRDIPIYTAARGPRMLELAGELTDGVIIHGLTQPFIEFVQERIVEGQSLAGGDAPDCEVVVMTHVEIDDDEAAAVDRLRPRCLGMAGGAYSDSMIPLLELDPDDVTRLRSAVRSGDADASALVTDQMVKTFAISGSEAEVAERLRALHELGVGRVIVSVPWDATLDEGLESIRKLGKVISRVQT